MLDSGWLCNILHAPLCPTQIYPLLHEPSRIHGMGVGGELGDGQGSNFIVQMRRLK